MTLRARLCARFTPAPEGATAYVSSTGALELRGPFAGALPRYFLRNVTAGMLDGDEYEVDISVEAGARVAVAPTSATKIFVARGTGAVLRTRLEVGSNAVLEYDSGLTIPHAGAVASQTTEIVLHEGARVAFGESLAFGRLAHGERFAFERLESCARVVTPTGVERFVRRSLLMPRDSRAHLEVAVGKAGVLGSLMLLGDGHRPALSEVDGVYAGVSALPHDLGWQVQALAARPEQVTQLMAGALAEWHAAQEPAVAQIAIG